MEQGSEWHTYHSAHGQNIAVNNVHIIIVYMEYIKQDIQINVVCTNTELEGWGHVEEWGWRDGVYRRFPGPSLLNKAQNDTAGCQRLPLDPSPRTRGQTWGRIAENLNIFHLPQCKTSLCVTSSLCGGAAAQGVPRFTRTVTLRLDFSSLTRVMCDV